MWTCTVQTEITRIKITNIYKKLLKISKYSEYPFKRNKHFKSDSTDCTIVCPGSLHPFHIVSLYIKMGKDFFNRVKTEFPRCGRPDIKDLRFQ